MVYILAATTIIGTVLADMCAIAASKRAARLCP